MTRRIGALLLLAARAAAHWPRYDFTRLSRSGDGKLRLESPLTIHIPKAGGTSLSNAYLYMRCGTWDYNRSAEDLAVTDKRCIAACVATRANARANGVLRPNADWRGCYANIDLHTPRFEVCKASYGLADVFEGWKDSSNRPFSPTKTQGAICAAMWRDPFERAVSGFLYHGHHPGYDFFQVGWPPRGGLADDDASTRRLATSLQDLDRTTMTYTWSEDDRGKQVRPETPNATRRSASFLEYARARAYTNVATRMLGDNAHAYGARRSGGLAPMPDAASLRRAVGALRRIPFGLLEAADASWLLLAHALSTTRDACAAIAAALAPHRTHARGDVTGGHARGKHSPQEAAAAAAIRANATLRAAFERRNGLDRRLYDAAVVIFCDEWRRALADGDSCVRDLADAPPALCATATSRDVAALDAAYPPFRTAAQLEVELADARAKIADLEAKLGAA